MSRKNNPTIVAIAAHPKLLPGMQMYLADDGVVDDITLLTRPYWKGYLYIPGGSWWIDYTRNDGCRYVTSVSDDGVQGFAYDDRPTRLVKTREEAEQCLVDTEIWWANTEHERIVSPNIDYDGDY